MRTAAIAICALLVTGCEGSRQIVPLLSTAGVPLTPPTTVPLRVVTRSTAVHDPLPMRGSDVAYGDVEAALGHAISSATVPWARRSTGRTRRARTAGSSSSRSPTPTRATTTGASSSRSACAPRCARARATSTSRRRRRAAGKVASSPPDKGAPVMYSCMMEIGRDLDGWLDGVDLDAVATARRDAPSHRANSPNDDKGGDRRERRPPWVSSCVSSRSSACLLHRARRAHHGDRLRRRHRPARPPRALLRSGQRRDPARGAPAGVVPHRVPLLGAGQQVPARRRLRRHLLDGEGGDARRSRTRGSRSTLHLAAQVPAHRLGALPPRHRDRPELLRRGHRPRVPQRGDRRLRAHVVPGPAEEERHDRGRDREGAPPAPARASTSRSRASSSRRSTTRRRSSSPSGSASSRRRRRSATSSSSRTRRSRRSASSSSRPRRRSSSSRPSPRRRRWSSPRRPSRRRCELQAEAEQRKLTATTETEVKKIEIAEADRRGEVPHRLGAPQQAAEKKLAIEQAQIDRLKAEADAATHGRRTRTARPRARLALAKATAAEKRGDGGEHHDEPGHDARVRRARAARRDGDDVPARRLLEAAELALPEDARASRRRRGS